MLDKDQIFFIKRTYSEIKLFLTDLIGGGGFYLFIGILLILKNHFFGIILIFFFLRHFFYNRLETVLNIRIVVKGDRPCVKFAGISWPISKEHSFLIMEDIRLLTGGVIRREYAIVLVRNTGKGWQRFFKNRIKLYVEHDSPLEPTMKSISECTGIRHLDFFEDPFADY